MLFAFVGAALALPPAILGPDGPFWVGPLPPGEGRDLVIVVDPVDGDLWVEENDPDGLRRVWDGTHWTRNDQEIQPESLPSGHRMRDGKLVVAPTAYGEERRYLYDDDGRLQVLLWASGGRLVVRYDDEGRVSEVLGPGPVRMKLQWSNGLTIRDALGRDTHVRTNTGDDRRVLTVRDALGRTAVTRYQGVGEGRWRLMGWTDPRGLETRLTWNRKRLDIQGPAVQLTRVGFDAEQRVETITMPGGQRWTWRRDAEGRIERLLDPSGRVTRWERDAKGAVVTRTVGGHITRIRRDESGRPVSVTLGNGGTTQMLRDDWGRIRSIIDAVGNTLFIERYENGWPSAIVERNGARWGLSLDALGRPDTIEDPTGRIVHIERDSAGRVVGLDDGVHAAVRFGWSADGQLTRVIDGLGRTSGFVRDAIGRLRALIRPDGMTVRVERDPTGEVVRITMGSHRLSITRGLDGRARSLGPIQWKRDINGRIRSVETPALSLALVRDPSGLLRTLRSGSWSLGIERNAAGWPIRWSGTDGEIQVTRDGIGSVVAEKGESRIRALRDSRGNLTRVTVMDLGEWRWGRDSTGRPLTTRGPEGVHAGIDRDPAGRVKLVRYPSGALSRREYLPDGMTEQVVDSGGRVLIERAWKWDADGHFMTMTEGEGGQTWHRDPSGRVISIEREDGRAWSWTMDGSQDPEGHLVLTDESGRVTEAQVSGGPSAWGIATNLLSVHRDGLDRMERLAGEKGVATLRYDALGRLDQVRLPNGRSWRVRYDARGRPARITTPMGEQRRWVWWPMWNPSDGLMGLLASGTEGHVSWVAGSDGPAARRDGLLIEDLVVSANGDLVWILAPDGAQVRIEHTPSGYPSSDVGGLLAAGSGLQWFPGGPIQRGWITMDPLSGERIDGARTWPWEVASLRETVDHQPWDPGPWKPRTPWSDPIRLLADLGALSSLDPGPWSRLESAVPTLFGLPDSLDGSTPPLGPAQTALPLGPEDPVTDAFVRALLPGGSPPTADTVVSALLEAEIPLPWMPPGWVVPGLESWLDNAAASDR